MASFYHNLIEWYNENKRELPWRQESDAYEIWLSEIILQQTRVEQGTSYYHKFTTTYPTVQDLANANEDEVLKLWEGLGYYSRGRNLLATAKVIANEMEGVFPSSAKELSNLKGIGPYTSAAISSIVNNERIAAIDGNVFRVLSRFFDIDLDISVPKTRNYFQDLGDSLIEGDEPGKFNQAIMDLGASHCSPKNFDCNLCPLQNSCLSFANGNIQSRPVKTKKIKIRDRYLNFILLFQNDTVIIEKRTEGIWNGLYQFPLVELEENNTLKESDLLFNTKNLTSLKNLPKPHKLSHQNLHITFWKAELINYETNNKLINVSELSDFSWPKPLQNFIENDLSEINI